ncbi:MAG: hypothetical protein PUC30_11835 [Lachnospiraceae bacterium]|nr:hypothetical protein [Lachnospiraceae bacterium]
MDRENRECEFGMAVYVDKCNEVLAYVNRRIAEGEQPFKNGGNV